MGKTIAKNDIIYNGVEYPIECDFGENYPEDAALFMFEEGNYSCDCNRSIFINEQHGDCIKELECGDTIKMKDLVITIEN